MEDLRLAAGHLDCILDGVDKAQLIAVALPCMVEVGAVVHAGADDGQAQRDVDALHSLPLLLLTVVDEADGLEGDMALIVVHADHDVVPAADGLRENAVWRAGTHNTGDALGLGSLDGRGDLLDLLAAEQAVLAAVGV